MLKEEKKKGEKRKELFFSFHFLKQFSAACHYDQPKGSRPELLCHWYARNVMEGCLGIVDLENEMGKPSVPGLVSVAMPWLDSHAHSVLRGEFIEVQNLVWLFQLLTFCFFINEV